MTPTKSEFECLEKYKEVVHYCNECRCGFCRENCPMYTVRTEFAHARGVCATVLGILDGVVSPSQHFAENLALCTTCGWCTQRCPLNLIREFTDAKGQIDLPKIVEATREELVSRSLVPPKVRDFLGSISNYGNPWKLPRARRGEWAKGTKIGIFKPKDEYLYYVGNTASYDARGNQIALSLGEVLLKSGVSVGILGNDEDCDGNDVKTLGEKGLFELLAEKNIKTFVKSGVKKIVALSPHAYNAIKNYYPQYGGTFEVVHFTQLLEKSIKSRKLRLTKKINAKVTFHDPCYLGRHNKEFDAPRNILRAVPGLKLLEMQRSRENSFCCGGGSANYYTDLLKCGENSPNRIRVREAHATGADILAVACPDCMTMLEDATKEEGLENKLIVRDISEIVRESSQ
jgi:Fe-S oxidoreductase